MLKLKSFRFWFLMIALLIVIINALGYDDYGILLYFSNPFLWMVNHYPTMRQAHIPIGIFYVTELISWYGIGWIIDSLIQKVKR
ncbi:hypothetical protein J2Z32_002668 [Paenibacillus turicensis]|uniref:DUF1461 domain-containing protein n=1 Tax=Paenibacillus turicensis TaxID=160487 RepID=A0ABS4FTV9_9BACL|nr:hypothetical protein [Paenibacillus turicensis]MBP1906019.1 hypothetical protein [Paenibacillus turicensis]